MSGDTVGGGIRVSLFTRPFVLLCLAMFLGYANQWVLTPVIPLYVDDMGGSAFVAGPALLAFSVPSFTVRPYVGYVADKWSAAGVLAIGLVLLSAGSVLFLVPWLAMVFVAGVVRGLGWAGLNIGGYTTLAMAAPQSAGARAGYYTRRLPAPPLVPALGLWLIDGGGGFPFVFILSAVVAARAADCSKPRPSKSAVKPRRTRPRASAD
jgi:MFS family permease